MTNTSVSFVCYCCPFLFDGMARLMKQNRPNMEHKKTTVSGTYYFSDILRALQQNRAQSRLLYFIIPGALARLRGGGGGLFNLAKMVGGEFG